MMKYILYGLGIILFWVVCYVIYVLINLLCKKIFNGQNERFEYKGILWDYGNDRKRTVIESFYAILFAPIYGLTSLMLFIALFILWPFRYVRTYMIDPWVKMANAMLKEDSAEKKEE